MEDIVVLMGDVRVIGSREMTRPFASREEVDGGDGDAGAGHDGWRKRKLEI